MYTYKSMNLQGGNVEEKIKYLSEKLSKGTINRREYIILEHRIKYKKTLEEIGLIFDVTRERIRQIETGADRKICYSERKKRLAPLKELLENFPARAASAASCEL